METAWTGEELTRIGGADEVRVSSRRADGSLRPFITIWVIRLGDELYVRSAYGPDNGWFRRARASGEGRIRAGGVQRDIGFDEPGHDIDPDLHAAYHAKYDRYGPAIVGTVVSSEAAASTLRLVPR
jgi:hypothetical protein